MLGVTRKRSALLATAVLVVASVAATAHALPTQSTKTPIFSVPIARTTWAGSLAWTVNGSSRVVDAGDEQVTTETVAGKTTMSWSLRSEKTDPWQVDVGKATIAYTGTGMHKEEYSGTDPQNGFEPVISSVTCGGGATVKGVGTKSGYAKISPRKARLGTTIGTFTQGKKVRVEMLEAPWGPVGGINPACKGEDAVGLSAALDSPSPNGAEAADWNHIFLFPGSAHRAVISVSFNASKTYKNVCGAGCNGTLVLKSTIRIYPRR